MATTNLDHQNLDAMSGGSAVRENVLEKIWEIDNIPLPFTELVGADTTGNRYAEFVTDELGAAATDNKQVDGADIDQDDSQIGDRQGNHCQISVKSVRVSTRADAANSIGRMGDLGYQVSQAQKRLRRDVEAQMLTPQASVQDDGNTVAGVSGGLAAWIKTNASVGATGSVGGFNATTKVIDAPTAGTKRALTETLLRDMLQLVYEAGGDSEYLMSTPQTIRIMSEYMFTSSARIAVQQNAVSNPGGPMEAVGSVNVFISDFGQVVKMKDNRLQAETAAGVADLFILDPAFIRQSFMKGYAVEPLAKTGLSEKRLISVDYTLLVTNEKSQGIIRDIDTAVAMTT